MFAFIINPIAGGGRGERVYSKVKSSVLFKKIESQSYFTEYKGHAEEITIMLIERFKDKLTAIIVIGGDGTLYEVVNGIANENISISFIPGGSGNDFARGCSIDQDPVKALDKIINGEDELTYYLGSYTIDENRQRLFANNIAFGFDAMVARTANHSWYKKILNKIRLGKISYIIALIHVLIKFKPMELEIVINHDRKRMSNCWMVTIANHPYYGGGMKIIPDAKIQPNIMPVLLIHSISKWKILGLFMTVFTGKHIHFKEVELYEATEISIIAPHRIHYQIDGETGMCITAHINKRDQAISILGTTKNKHL